MTGRTHYDVLGVAPDSTASEVRAAYRRLARLHHPDARGSAERMAEVNEAWRVLGDPARRREYDRLAGAESSAGRDDRSTSTSSPPVSPVVVAAPVRFPWKFMAGMAAVGIAVVVVGAVTFQQVDPPPADRVLTAGSCVVIETNGDAAEVNCSEPHDAVVEVLVPFDGVCPFGTDPHRDRQGLGVACVRRP